MKFIIGKKLEMTQVWRDGNVVAVTKVQAGPCVVTQVKNNEKDGYLAVQIGFGEKKEKNIKKPQKGHLKKSKTNSRYLREFRTDVSEKNLKIGDKIDVSTFDNGDEIQVIGTSKGKGFQGVVKRHGFKGSKKTHGNKDQLRMPGSIGATGPAHVFKGTKMGGRMGGDRVTVKNLEVVDIDIKNNILLVKGAVPGARNGLILVCGKGELKLKVESDEIKNEEAGIKQKEDKIEKKEVKENDMGEEKQKQDEKVEKKLDKKIIN